MRVTLTHTNSQKVFLEIPELFKLMLHVSQDSQCEQQVITVPCPSQLLSLSIYYSAWFSPTT